MAEVPHSKPTLTVFADASLYLKERVAGWGGWARGDNRAPTAIGGPCDFHTDTSVLELEALAGTLRTLHETGYLLDTDQSILLQSDSLPALCILNSEMPNSWASARDSGSSDIMRNRRAKDAHWPYVKPIKTLLGSRQIVYLRHVKAHRGGATSRNWVNEQCDARAKFEARKQMEAVNG